MIVTINALVTKSWVMTQPYLGGHTQFRWEVLLCPRSLKTKNNERITILYSIVLQPIEKYLIIVTKPFTKCLRLPSPPSSCLSFSASPPRPRL